MVHHATHHTITDTNKSLTKATATTTASKQEALEEHYRPSTHGKSFRAESCDQLAPSPTPTPHPYSNSSLCLRALLERARFQWPPTIQLISTLMSASAAHAAVA